MKPKISLFVSLVLALTFVLPAAAQTPESVQQSAQKYAANHQRVDVQLADRTKLRGRIEKAETDSFTIADEKSGERTVRYADAIKLKKHGLSRGAKVGMGVGIAAAVVVVAVGLAVRSFGNSVQ